MNEVKFIKSPIEIFNEISEMYAVVDNLKFKIYKNRQNPELLITICDRKIHFHHPLILTFQEFQNVNRLINYNLELSKNNNEYPFVGILPPDYPFTDDELG